MYTCFSEIFYTGGGIWCGVMALNDGTFFSGELNSWGTYYKTIEAADELLGDNDPEFIRYAGEEDFCQVMAMWKEAITREKKTRLEGYTDEWMKENERITNAGDFDD